MAIGWTAERVAYRPLRRAPRLAALITAIGVSIILQNVAMMGWGRNYLNFPQVLAPRVFDLRRAHQHAADRHRGHRRAHHGRAAGRGAQDPPGHGHARHRAEPRSSRPDGREHQHRHLGRFPDRFGAGRRGWHDGRHVLRRVAVHHGLHAGPEGLHRGRAGRHRQPGRRDGRRPVAGHHRIAGRRLYRRPDRRLPGQPLSRRVRFLRAGAGADLPPLRPPGRARGDRA